MRLTLVISSVARGGAERVVSILASAWAERGQAVTLLTLDHGDAHAYVIHRSVRCNALGLNGPSRGLIDGLWRNARRVRALRYAIRESRPDVVISFMDQTNVLTVLATRGLRIPVIVTEHIDPSLYDIGTTWNNLRKLTYRFADRLVCLTNSTSARFQSMIGVKGCVIPNPVVLPMLCKEAKKRDVSTRSHLLVAMGRLVRQKGFDLLLSAFSRVAERHSDWCLQLLGEGPLGAELEEQARTLNVADRVHFAGAIGDPFAVLHAADLFVFPSRFEGFGMALCEAMACGLPAVSFDCPSGPSDIIRDGVDGVLVPPGDVTALAAALDRLMGDTEERQRLAARAPEVLERFSEQKVLAMWTQLFDSLAPGK